MSSSDEIKNFLFPSLDESSDNDIINVCEDEPPDSDLSSLDVNEVLDFIPTTPPTPETQEEVESLRESILQLLEKNEYMKRRIEELSTQMERTEEQQTLDDDDGFPEPCFKKRKKE